MFARIKQTLSDRFNSVSGSTDTELAALQQKCEECTSEYLLNEDWGSIIELCTMLDDARDLKAGSDRVLKTLAKRLEVKSTRVQLLALAVADACVQNCGPMFQQQLAASSFWADMNKMVTPAAKTRAADVEVADRILTLIEDWARAVPLDAYSDAIERLLQQGVRFPMRPEASKAPHCDPQAWAQEQQRQFERQEQRAQQPPSQRTSQSQPDPGAGAQWQRYQPVASTADAPLLHNAARSSEYNAAGAPVRTSQGSGQPGRPSAHVDHATLASLGIDAAALEGMSPADRAAVLQALKEPSPVAPPPPPPAAAAAAAAVAEQVPRFASPARGELSQDLTSAATTVLLLKEVLQNAPPGSDPSRDPLAAELVAHCSKMQPALAEVIPRVEDEALLDNALRVHDDLKQVLEQHDRLMAAATSSPAAAEVAPEAHASASAMPPASGVAEHDPVHAPPPLQAPVELLEAYPPPRASAPDATPNLIDFDADPLPPQPPTGRDFLAASSASAAIIDPFAPVVQTPEPSHPDPAAGRASGSAVSAAAGNGHDTRDVPGSNGPRQHAAGQNGVDLESGNALSNSTDLQLAAGFDHLAVQDAAPHPERHDA